MSETENYEKKNRISRRSFLKLSGGAAAALAGGYFIRDRMAPSLRLTGFDELDNFKEFDVCIVGSGPAGAVLGADLISQGLHTVILESGPSSGTAFNSRYQKLEVYRSSGELEYPFLSTRVRALGGTSNIWTGRNYRYRPGDIDANPYAPENGPWPIRYEEIEPYYEQAEQTLRVREVFSSEYSPPRRNRLPHFWGRDEFSQIQGLLKPAGLQFDEPPWSQRNFFERGPVRMVPDILPEFSRSPYATLVPGATVTRLIPDSKGTVSGAEVHGLDGEVKILRAKTYVLAGGCIENARLLLLSRTEDFPAGLGNQHDLVGRYFMEDPDINFEARIPGMKATRWEHVRSSQYYEGFKRRGLGGVFLGFMQKGDTPDILDVSLGIEMFPSPSNRVTLDTEITDSFGSPAPNISINFTEKDRETFSQAREIVLEIYARLGAQEPREMENVVWSHHPMGTCRMGDYPETSVTDRNLRVHGIQNLYVSGSAVFATAGSGHPTLLIVALAHRLAGHLSTKLRG